MLKVFPFQRTRYKDNSGAVTALAMTFNELCSNTTKFGALSVLNGRVAIAGVTLDDRSSHLVVAALLPQLLELIMKIEP
jgi:two-component sensor histidine kinase